MSPKKPTVLKLFRIHHTRSWFKLALESHSITGVWPNKRRMRRQFAAAKRRKATWER